MKKIVLAFAFIGLLISTQVAVASSFNNIVTCVDEKCDKCGKKDCEHQKKAETEKKNCTANKACCSKKAEAKTEAKKSCCAHTANAKSCSKTTEKKDDKQ
ncbi:MAG: hypothetical protein KDD41_00690 [Flavobacteriales bacterium]|nr:hypothetical protein [Flavobacteriales bacterium]